MRTLDELDCHIISLQNQDGRLSSAAIGCNLGTVTLRTVANRMNNLFDQGVVTETLVNLPGVRRTQTHLLPAKIKDIDSWLPRSRR